MLSPRREKGLVSNDADQPIGEIDDSSAEDCITNGPLYGHPNVVWIHALDAPFVVIDERINPNIDPNSDGIDFPPLDAYAFRFRMRPYIHLQKITVPSSNVILLYVRVHYDSGMRSLTYQSKRQQDPKVENFLAGEPFRFFDIYLNETDDGQPPTDVTLYIVSMIRRSTDDLYSYRMMLELLHRTARVASQGKSDELTRLRK